VTATKRLSDSEVTVWEPSRLGRTHRRDEIETHRIGVDHEDVLVEGGVDPDDVAHLVVNFELEGIHWGIEVNSIEVMEEQDLRITLATVAWALALTGPADFDNHHISALGIRPVVTVEQNDMNTYGTT